MYKYDVFGSIDNGVTFRYITTVTANSWHDAFRRVEDVYGAYDALDVVQQEDGQTEKL